MADSSNRLALDVPKCVGERMCRGISHIHSLELGMFMKQPASDVLKCVAERMCMEEDMDDVSLFYGYVWSC